jgi:superfamily II RNA helicase
MLSTIQLFCIDEVHFVGADVRGAVLEVLVSRIKTLGTATRFVALSATIPNVNDIAEWLGEFSRGSLSRPLPRLIKLFSIGDEFAGEEGGAEVFTFGEEYRPCKLSK